MSTLLYFAYGSNISTRRLQARLSTVHRVGVAALSDHRLVFHKAGQDRSAKCDIVTAAGQEVLGVVYRLGTEDKHRLDRIEGVGQGYENREITVTMRDGSAIRTHTYTATDCDPRLLPFDWYLRHVLEGALEAGLPEPYVAMIRATPMLPDPDRDRALKELRLYHRQTPGGI